jgi:hypothetical protein
MKSVCVVDRTIISRRRQTAVVNRDFADQFGIGKIAALKEELERRGLADFDRHRLQNILWR